MTTDNTTIIQNIKIDLNKTIQQIKANDDIINFFSAPEKKAQTFDFKLLGVVSAAFYFGMLSHGIYVSRNIKRQDIASQFVSRLKSMATELQ